MATPDKFEAFLKRLRTSADSRNAADGLARAVKTNGFVTLIDREVLSTMLDLLKNKQAAGAIGLNSLATVLGPVVLPQLLPSLPTLIQLFDEKDEKMRTAAQGALKAIVGLTPVEAFGPVLDVLLGELKGSTKWQGKLGCLKEVERFVTLRAQEGKEELASLLGTVLPPIEMTMHDTKSEVCAAPSIVPKIDD